MRAKDSSILHPGNVYKSAEYCEVINCHAINEVPLLTSFWDAQCLNANIMNIRSKNMKNSIVVGTKPSTHTTLNIYDSTFESNRHNIVVFIHKKWTDLLSDSFESPSVRINVHNTLFVPERPVKYVNIKKSNRLVIND